MRAARVWMAMALAATVGAPATAAQEGSPVAGREVLTAETLWALRRVGGPVVSPAGDRVVYPVTRYDVEADRGDTDLHLVSVTGGEPARLTDWEGAESSPAWRPDGRRLGFLSSRSGDPQLWEVRPDGSDPRQVTSIEGGIANLSYAPDGRHVAFTRAVRVDPTLADRHPDLPEAEARVIDDLMYRHWDSWEDGTYEHLFLARYDDGSIRDVRDLMPGERWDTPLPPFGGAEQIAWSPDGGTLAYTAKKKFGTEFAVSTDSDIYLYDLATGETRSLTEGMDGYDVEPVFSPDGGWIAWLSMRREGYESDRNRLFVARLDGSGRRELSAGFDGDAHSPAWSADGATIWFTSETDGTIQIFAADVAAGTVRRVTDGMHDYTGVAVARRGNRPLLVAPRRSMSAPVELYAVDPADGAATALTAENAELLAGIRMGRVEARWVTSADGSRVHAWVIYPPDFDPARRWPALLYAQGGPQSAVSQFFSYRWNFQLMAAHGYVVIAPNRRGVPGFGQEWKEEISGDWGGRAMEDLVAAADDLAAEPWVDEDRMGAVGASFGGYSMFWLAGHHEGRFRTFVAHAGVFNLESMYGATEELFFVNFDLGGPYWRDPAPPSWTRFSPHEFVARWDTPMLIIHGQRDYRVPVTEGMQAFTALRAQGIEARFLYFPSEGHWVLQPQNGILWHREFFRWLDRWLKPPA